jgi:nucleoside-diphosphate-sugar epimerase
MTRLAAVTGATGFLGRRLVGVLKSRGFEVRALVRREWDGEPVEVVDGDLADEAALARLVDGAEVLVHVAGAVKARDRSAFMEVNGRGAARAAQAAARAGARAVLVSSLVAREPRLSPYAASKRAGETAARQALGDRLTVVRPPAIYGPGDRATFDLFWAASKSPVLPVPDVRGARLALAYVDDICADIGDLAQAPSGEGPIELGGARPGGYAWAEIVEALCRAAGRRPLPVRLPGWAVIAAGAASQGLARLTGRPSMLTLGKAREILHPDWSVADIGGAQARIRAATDLDTGFARTLQWYRDAGWMR